MVQKTFLWHLKSQQFANKKAITKELFYKSYVRELLAENNKIKVIDNGSMISDFFYKDKSIKKKIIVEYKVRKKQFRGKKWNKQKKLTKIERVVGIKKIYPQGKVKIGTALNIEHHILRHRFWDKIQIKVPVIPNAKNLNLFKLSNCARKLTARNKANTQKFLPIQLLKPLKGGFKVRFSLLKGFLPNRHFYRAKRAVKKEVKNIKQSEELKFLKKQFVSQFSLLKNSENDINFKSKMLELSESIKNLTIKRKEKKSEFWKMKINQRLPLKVQNLKYKSPNKKARFVKKRKLGTRRKFFFKRKPRKMNKKSWYFKTFLKNPFKYKKLGSLRRLIFIFPKLNSKNKKNNF